MELLILPEPDGTHAKVRFSGVVSDPPADAQRVQPGGSHDGIPYDAWRARMGQRVDVAALRVRLAAEVEEERSRAAHDDALGPKPSGLGPYGFVHAGRKSALTREGLQLRCAGLEPPEAGWSADGAAQAARALR